MAALGNVLPMTKVFITPHLKTFIAKYRILVVRFRAKRKAFDQLTKYGKRKCLNDIRVLFKKRQDEYNVPVSRMAGYVIQQVLFRPD